MPRFNTVLLVSGCREADCLMAADGSPVWPLCSSDDISAVQQLATVFGARVQWVGASAGTARPLSAEDVLALGPDACSAARLYAHLTRRRHRVAENLDALVRTECPSVVVTTPEYLTPELLDWLYNQPGRTAPGIICADRGAPLLRQVLVRSAAAALCGPLTVTCTEIFPTMPALGFRDAGTEVLGSETSALERRQALSRGAGVLTISTHSDGIDAFMGTDLTICARNRVMEGIGLSAAPRCRLTDFCHRHETSVAHAIQTAALFPVDQIAARVFVWDVCFGVMPAGSVVDPRWGIGARLLESPRIGAILTTWQIVLSSPDHAQRISRLIASGVPVGVAVKRFNASHEAQAHNYRMCILGDPRVMLPRVQVSRLPKLRPNRVRHLPNSRPDDIRQLSLLRLCMLDAKGTASTGPRTSIASHALEAIDAFEVTAAKGPPLSAQLLEAENEMRISVLRYVFSRGKIFENWLPFARHLRASPLSRCPVCERKAHTLHAVMHPSGVTARRLAICPICGVLEDAPTTSDLGFILDGRRIHLRGNLPQERWMAGVLIASSYYPESIGLMWPPMNDGTPAPYMDLPQRWPLGPLRISVIFVWDANFAVISRMAMDPTQEDRSTARSLDKSDDY
jgi:hypothetical protein